jgi:hypothetical protein
VSKVVDGQSGTVWRIAAPALLDAHMQLTTPELIVKKAVRNYDDEVGEEQGRGGRGLSGTGKIQHLTSIAAQAQGLEVDYEHCQHHLSVS